MLSPSGLEQGHSGPTPADHAGQADVDGAASSRVRYYQSMASRSSKYPYLMWLVSIVPGVGHALLGKTRWAFGLGVAWFLTSILETGTLTVRPGSWVMMVQCFAMSDAFLRARERTNHWSLGLLVNIVTAILLALIEMHLIGGILS